MERSTATCQAPLVPMAEVRAKLREVGVQGSPETFRAIARRELNARFVGGRLYVPASKLAAFVDEITDPPEAA